MDEQPKQIIAAFDFDCTITKHDALIYFLIYSKGIVDCLTKFISLAPQLIGYLFGCISRQQTKELIFTKFFKGMSISQLKELGTAFAHSENINKLLNRVALKRIEWHRNQNHRLILISAGIDAYLKPWANLAGFDDIICSKVAVSQDNKVTGKLDGLNCWGPEKTRRLLELCGPRDSFILYAYGDSRGDKELLATADYPFYRTMS